MIVKLRVVEKSLRALHDELRDRVDLTALEGEDLRRLARVEGEACAVEVGPAAPVGRVGDELGSDVLRIALELERTCTDERALPLAEVGALRDDDRVVVVRGHEVREVAVGCGKVEGDGHRVDLLHAARREHPGERRQRVGRVLRIRELLEGVDDVVGRHRLPVVEGDARAQLERPDGAVFIGGPAQGEHRLEHELEVVVEGEELAGLVEHRQATGVGHGERVDRGRGRLGRHLQRAALLGRACRGRRSGRGRARAVVRAAARRQDRSHQRGRHPDHGTARDKLPPTDPARYEFVDVVVLELAASPADRV